MAELISEPLTPAGAFDTQAMARGEPGLPSAFRWRDEVYVVRDLLRKWKHSTHEGGHTGGDLYLRRHYYLLRMSDGTLWTVYFLRQSPRSGKPTRRWFLYTIERLVDAAGGVWLQNDADQRESRDSVPHAEPHQDLTTQRLN